MRRAALPIVVAALVLLPARADGARPVDSWSIGPRGGPGVLVERAPFRISFWDAERRRPLLREVTNRGLSPRPLPATRDPEPYSLESEPDRAVYAPLSFEVGKEVRAQWNGGLWNGNMLFSRRSGVRQFARRVVSAAPVRGGLRFVISTSDERRRLIVVVTGDRGSAFRVRARVTPSRGVITVGDSFVAPRREAFHGFGGRHGELDKRGQKLYGWAEQEGFGGEATLRQVSLLPALIEAGTDYTAEQLGVPARIPEDLPGGFERYIFPGGPNAAYYPQAQFVSSRGYGFLLNQNVFSRWRMASDRPHAWQVQASSARLDYTVVIGPRVRGAVGDLTAITGRHRLPPPWAQGAMLSRAVSVPALPGLPATETAASYRARVLQDLADIERYDVPISAYAFEGWALLDDLDFVRGVIRRLRRRGIRAVVYHRAYVSDDALSTQPKGDFEQVLRLGLVAKTAAGEPYVFGSNGGSPATLLDFTNQRTVRWWRRRLELTLDLGASGFMQDFGEQVQDGMRFADGSRGVEMHNRYSVLWHRISREIVDAYARRKDLKEPIWFFNRAGYSGRPGSAAYEMANFPGDETADWGAGSGLRSLAPDMLNRAVGGAFGYTADIGGYADFLTGAADAELFTRWTEWAALSPYFRVHNSAVYGVRMPWSYDRRTLARWKALAALHRRAVPLTRRLWRRGRRTGVPPTRPLWLAFPGDRRAAVQDQQWMLGPDVLVAPVVREGARARRVYFPAGCWRHGQTGRRYRGRRYARVAAPLGRLPWFVRCGTRPLGR